MSVQQKQRMMHPHSSESVGTILKESVSSISFDDSLQPLIAKTTCADRFTLSTLLEQYPPSDQDNHFAWWLIKAVLEKNAPYKLWNIKWWRNLLERGKKK